MNQHSNIKAAIGYDDLREWLSAAEALGEVRNVKGASWQEDIGLAAEAILRAEDGPCVVFDDVPGCPKGFRVLLNMFAGTRRNMTLGFPDHLNKWELSDAYREAYLVDPKLLPHEIVDDGPVLENVLTGDAIDVTKFPSPIWHEKDGGRYIGTGTYSITRDPEENWLNAGAYRAMVHDKTVGRLRHRARPSRLYPSREILGARRSHAGRDGAGRRSAGVLLRRRRGALRHVRTRHRRRHARPADQDGARQGHRPALPGQRRDRARRFCHARQAPGRRPVRRMDRALCRRQAADPGARYRGDLSPQRSDPGRRAADGRRARTRWRAIAP